MNDIAVLTAWNACHAAARTGDAEAADRHWREFVRLLWLPMAEQIPWDPPAKDNEVRG